MLTLLRLFFKLKSNESRCMYSVAWNDGFSTVASLDKGADNISLPVLKYHLMSMSFLSVVCVNVIPLCSTYFKPGLV